MVIPLRRKIKCIILYLLWFVLDFIKLYLFVNCGNFVDLLWFVLDFIKLYLFVNCGNFVELPNYMCCGEIINSLFKGSVLIFINAIAEL
jgi:hypothetical protein